MNQIPDLDAAGLRHFGLTTGMILAALFGLVLPWLLGASFPVWPWVIAAVLTIWALVAPKTLRPVYRGWMRGALLAGRVTTPLILSLLFFLLFTPIGLIMRLAGREPLRRRLDPTAASYREPSEADSPQSMERPF